ncbi:MAG: trans-2-enoyl-CoA reductase family protein [Treponema sp.]|nr:trans-2-enoyl-CoA reductase family protein [Treponema sp.]
MNIKPKVRGNICMNADPDGCERETLRQIDFARSRKQARDLKTYKEGGAGPKFVLVIGCSTGYGLASRITSAFEYGADTIGISFEKEASEVRSATPGFYNNAVFDKIAVQSNLISKTFNIDAFSHEAKNLVIQEAKKLGRKFDLVIYSLASSVRVDPDSHEVYHSVVKTQDCYYKGWGINILQDCLVDGESQIATEEDIKNTVKVMGGEDWQLWIDALLKADVLAEGCRSIAYSYIGPKESYPIYRSGTIGHAKAHLEKTAKELNLKLAAALGGRAFISVNKGVVTRSSAVIPVISLYLSVLFKIMKEKGIHEDCNQQMDRLFAERLYTGKNSAPANVPLDSEGRIRLDEFELREDVQKEAAELMAKVTEENFHDLTDVKGYIHDFYAINGFDYL